VLSRAAVKTSVTSVIRVISVTSGAAAKTLVTSVIRVIRVNTVIFSAAVE
jgi:hypothetical protein